MTKTTTTGELQFAARAAGDQLCWAVGCREWNAGAIVLLPPGGGMVSIPLCAPHKAQAQLELDARRDDGGPDDDGSGGGSAAPPKTKRGRCERCRSTGPVQHVVGNVWRCYKCRARDAAA